MPKHKKYTCTATAENRAGLIDCTSIGKNMKEEKKKRFKKELMGLFQKFGYLDGERDHEITFKTTSGNIAWINIKRIETIK